MMKRITCLVVLAGICAAGVGTGITAEKSSSLLGKKVAKFSLQDYRGKSWSLDDFKNSKLLVIAFMGTECPLAKLYGPRLAELSGKYKRADVAIVGINANVQDSVTEIAAYARRHKIDFPLLKDLGNKVADQMGAKRTPEIFVLDAKRKIVYHGRVDDQYGVGYVRDDPRRQDLKIALDELLAGKKVSRAETPVVGCIIGRVYEPKKNSKATYSKQIARILQKRCVECHRAGEIAPFALTKYEEVAGWAEMIAEVVEQGRMPPWHASPKHGSFANDRRLTDAEKKLIYQWVKNGAPRGNPNDLPKARKFVSGWQLPREPDVIINIQKKPYRVPAKGAVRYKYFIADPGFKEDKWVQAAQLLPGNRAVVHHILAFAVKKDARDELRELRGGTAGFLFGYVPGQLAYSYPEGMAKKIPAGAKLVFQVHYTPVGTEQMDQSKIGLVFTDPKKVRRIVKTRSAYNQFLWLPPGENNYKVEARTARPLPADAWLLGFMPHMHLRGKAFRYEAVFPNNKKEILLEVPAYDFNWQTAYRLSRHRKLPKGTYLHCTAWYDNSEDNLNNPDPTKLVRWGEQTWDEMMIGYYDYAVPIDSPSAKEKPLAAGGRQGGNAADKIFRFLDRDSDGKLSRKEFPARFADRFDQIDRDRNGEITLTELRRALGFLKKKKKK